MPNEGLKTDVGVLYLENVRINFPWLFRKAPPYKDSSPKYSVEVLISKDDKHRLVYVKDAIVGLISRTWPREDPTKVFAKIQESTTTAVLRDGDTKTGSGAESYADHWYIKGASETPPLVRDMENKDLTEADSGRIYSGMYANVVIELQPWSKELKITKVLKTVWCTFKGDRFVVKGNEPEAYAEMFFGKNNPIPSFAAPPKVIEHVSPSKSKEDELKALLG